MIQATTIAVDAFTPIVMQLATGPGRACATLANECRFLTTMPAGSDADVSFC
jgi:hypothetical protein